MTAKKKPQELRDEKLSSAAGGHFDEADALFGKKQQAALDSRTGVGVLKSTDAGATWR